MTKDLPLKVLHKIFCYLDNRDTWSFYDDLYDRLITKKISLDSGENEFIWQLHRSSYCDLYHCALVNRQWCQGAMPILWNRPFFHYDEVDSAMPNVLRTYVLSLTDADRSLLRENGLDVPYAIRRPMFDYPSFVRHLNLWELIMACRNWRDWGDKLALVVRIMLGLFKRRGIELTSLLLPLDDWYDGKYDEAICVIIEDEFMEMIAPIRYLEISKLTNIGKLACGLAQTCNNLEHINLSNLRGSSSSRYLSQLIKSQKQLISFYMVNGVPRVESSLFNQANSLRDVRLHSTDFQDSEAWHSLATCTMLERLDIVNCKNITVLMVEPLLNETLPYLKQVNVTFCKGGMMPKCRELEEWARVMNKGKRMIEDRKMCV
ncbi:9142_t:CDS:2 [Paraglomus brasilianum]|uniref:9142_t:CDS:1 n=1 Tax=Paraglomus brasilianum TaxID=144538 RepID=A0A9N8ZTU5_9GLOM|nr:9142_t:CDS:2 [Paraglomus brasilianum]